MPHPNHFASAAGHAYLLRVNPHAPAAPRGTRFCVASALLALLFGCGISGCSDGPAGGAEPAGAEPPADQWLLETDTGAQDARAGIEFVIKCRTFLPQPGAAGAGPAWGAERPLPAAATVIVVGGPAGPAEIDGTTVTLRRVGAYKVACQVPHFGLVDPTPAGLQVVPGPAKWLDTALRAGPDGPPKKALVVKAGTWISGECSGADAWANPIVQGWSLSSEPALAQPPPGLIFQAKAVKGYQIACAVDGQTDASPATLTVSANVPRHLFAHLEPEQIAAGNASKLSCLATDTWGNAILDFPMTVSHGEKVTLKGKYMTGTVAGLFTVRCVPETLAWELFEIHPASLHVVPGPPHEVVIAKVPHKVVYKRKDKVQFPALVRDVFGNAIGGLQVDMVVTAPAKGFKVMGPNTVQFKEDGKYTVAFAVAGHPQVTVETEILVDGAPPQLTIDYPPWGSTLTGKPSIQLTGKAGDDGAGIDNLVVNGKTAFPDGAQQWYQQHGAAHGLNRVLATATDLGGEQARATRGFYFSSLYYPTDAATPHDAMVSDAIQLFMGKDFFDDGIHDPAKPDDIATLMEIVANAIPINAILPPSLSQGDMDVSLSNASMGKVKMALIPVQGGLDVQVEVPDIHTDLKVKAKVKLGPISTKISVSGAIDIAKVTLKTRVLLSAKGGKVNATIASSSATVDGMKLHVNGIAGLFDFLWNILLDAYKGEFEKQIQQALVKELPGVFAQVFSILAVNESFELDPPLGQGPKLTLTLISRVAALEFTPAGGLIRLDATFVAAKGTSHVTLGALGRGGCIGKSPDAFAIDQSQRLQFAGHDDLINQLLYALWYAGGLKGEIPGSELAKEGETMGGFDLSKATVGIDLLLPPILEGCEVDEPSHVRAQVGDTMVTISLPIGAKTLSLYNAASVDMLAQLVLAKDDKGQPVLRVQAVEGTPMAYLFEMFDISKDFIGAKHDFAKIIEELVGKELEGGIPGLSDIELPLLPLEIDLAAISKDLPAGTKMTLAIKKLTRSGGYTALNAALE